MANRPPGPLAAAPRRQATARPAEDAYALRQSAEPQVSQLDWMAAMLNAQADFTRKLADTDAAEQLYRSIRWTRSLVQ